MSTCRKRTFRAFSVCGVAGCGDPVRAGLRGAVQGDRVEVEDLARGDHSTEMRR
jgi:hypothetical protein